VPVTSLVLGQDGKFQARRAMAPESTANNLALIREAREHRADNPTWADMVERELVRKAGSI